MLDWRSINRTNIRLAVFITVRRASLRPLAWNPKAAGSNPAGPAIFPAPPRAGTCQPRRLRYRSRMRYSVHIGREFRSVPAPVRKRLRSKLADISEVLEELGTRSPIMQSLLETTLVLSVGAWSFRYGLEQGRNRLTVFQAVNGGEL